jgi:hypothetical protein
MRAKVVGFLALMACDPVRSVQGRVLSQAEAGAATGLPGADVLLVCPRSREHLAKTGANGAFSYASIGYWPEGCALEASTFDGSHRSAARSIAELCQASSGEPDCLGIAKAELTLTRLRGERRTTRLVFRPDDPRMELVQHSGEREEVLCSGACETEVFAGEHHFSLRLRRTTRDLWSGESTLASDRTLHARFVDDPDPTWPSTVGTALTAAGLGLLLYGGVKEETVPAIAGLSAIGVGVALSVVWMPGMHSADVRWEPRSGHGRE